MTDEWQGVSKDEYVTDRLLSDQDWSDWRAACGWEPARRPTRSKMVAHFAAERAEVERETPEGIAERAVVRDGWRTYPAELRAEPKPNCPTCDGEGLTMGYGRTHSCERCGGTGRITVVAPASFVVHAALQFTGCGDPTVAELRAQLAGLGFDTIDIEEVAT